jgi:hypothetical protein
VNDVGVADGGIENSSASLSAGKKAGVPPMTRSDEYCRFTGECLKMARTAEDEQQRVIFLQMARVWFALVQKDEPNVDRNGDWGDQIS